MKIALSPYIEYRKSEDIHGTALYPAMMVAPMQREVLESVLPTDKEDVRICDPFMGSGTVLYEAGCLAPQAHLYGSDINPLAVLLSKVKLQGVDLRIAEDIGYIEERLNTSESVNEKHQFKNAEKWFKPDILMSLDRIRDAIVHVDCCQNRLFFWYMLVDIARKYSNSRSSTYKLHIRKQEQIDRIKNNVVADYINKVKTEYSLFTNPPEAGFTINQGDSVDFLKRIPDGYFDLCITSPPYGDNATTVPYGQYSMLALQWMSAGDLNLNGWELASYSAIDSRSLGGCANAYSKSSEELPEPIEKTIKALRKDKQPKVRRFLNGYKAFIREMIRTTKQTMVLTLGNRRVDGMVIDLCMFTEMLFEQYDCCTIDRKSRQIPITKRIPAITSNVNGKPVSSMKEEYVIIASR